MVENTAWSTLREETGRHRFIEAGQQTVKTVVLVILNMLELVTALNQLRRNRKSGQDRYLVAGLRAADSGDLFHLGVNVLGDLVDMRRITDASDGIFFTKYLNDNLVFNARVRH